MTDHNTKDIRELVKSMYSKGEIQEIQTRSNLVYEKLIRSGYDHLESIEIILSHGVEYNDIMSGILARGIDG